jgi:predicted FMN-binding regulatory protein PaiB
MYLPPHFEETTENEIAKLIEQFPLATIVCNVWRQPPWYQMT